MPSVPAPADPALDDDRALVAAVLDGRPDAFARLVRRYQGLCWHVVERMVRHPDDTRELCQEAFLRIHRNLHQYRGERPLKSWIAQVAWSVARRHLERRRIPLVDLDGEDEGGLPLAERVGDGGDLEAAFAGHQAATRLHAAIAALPPLQRGVLTLYHLEDMSIAGIAEVTGLAEGTIKSHLFRSRRQLRALLEPQEGTPA